MILDHQATRLLAEHGDAWANMLVRVGSGLRRLSRRVLHCGTGRHDQAATLEEIGCGSS